MYRKKGIEDGRPTSSHSIDSIYNQNAEDDTEEDAYASSNDPTEDEGSEDDLLSYNDETDNLNSASYSNSSINKSAVLEIQDTLHSELQSTSYGKIIEEPFLNPGDENDSEIDYSDDDTYSMSSENNGETILMQQQKKMTFDYKKQDEHESALKEMYDSMKRAHDKRSRSKKVKSFFRKIARWVSDWILSPDKFWSDLFYTIFTYFQIAGLLWIFPYILPSNVYIFTQFTIYFNLDFVSHREDRPNLLSWGLDNPPFYPYYLTPWLVIPPLLFAFWLSLPYLRFLPVIRRIYFELDRIIFMLLRLLYLPFLLHTFAYGLCGGKGASAFQCAAFCPNEFGWCLTRSVPAAIASLFYGVGVPLAFCLEVRKLIVYARNTRHMGYVANMEVEKLLKISNNYVLYRMYIISSYTRLGSYYVYIKEAVQKATLVIIWSSLDGRDSLGVYSWRSQVAISSFAFAVIVGPLIIELFWRPYRNLSLLLFNQLLGWVHVMNVMLAWFLALGVRSPFLLASQLTILILMVNATALFGGFVIMVLLLLLRIKWPINDQVVKELETNYNHYLKAIRNGYMLYAHALSTNPSFVRCDLIYYHKEYMQRLSQEAVMEKNPLEDTLEDCILKLEEEFYASQNLTILPHKPLQYALPSLRRNLDRRQTEMILIPTRKRILLLKVLALKVLVGHHQIARVHVGDPPPKDIDTPRDDEMDSTDSADFSTMDKLQAFLDQYKINLSSDDEDNSDKDEDEDIDKLLDAVEEKSVQSDKSSNDDKASTNQKIDFNESNDEDDDLLSD